MANAFGANPNSSLEAMLRLGASRADAATGAAQSGVSAAQSGLAQAQAVGREIDGYLGKASGLASDAARVINGADQDVEAMRALVPQYNTHISGITKSADNLSDFAAQLRGKASDISAYAPTVAGLGQDLLGRVGTTDALAGRVTGVAEGLQPHVDALTELSQHLFGHGHDMIGRSEAEMAVAEGLRNLDPSSSAQAAFWRQQFDAVNPETYAARAMADAQAQSENARAQMERDIARRGGSLTSGASVTLRQQLARALATATAAAATKGRLLGYDAQKEILKATGALANTQMSTGKDMFNSGIAAETQAGEQRKNAADVQATMGSLFKSAADIFGIGSSAIKGAGDLFGAAAGIEEGAGKMLSAASSAESASSEARGRAISGLSAQAGVLSDAAGKQIEQGRALNDTARVQQGNAQVKNQYLSNLNDANRTIVSSYGTLASAMDAAAKYYLGAAGQEVGANRGGGGGGGGGGGVRTSGGGSSGGDGGGSEEQTGAWVNLFPGSGHANHEWIWDPNAPAEPIDA